MHNQRMGKDGVFNTKHNDRSYNSEADEHVDKSLTSGNFCWNWCDGIEKENYTQDEAELLFYKLYLNDGLEFQNMKHRKKGNNNRVKTIDEYRKNKKFCPEETILQIGDKNYDVDFDLLTKIVSEQIAWEHETFKNVKYLNLYGHCDEVNAGKHFHARRVFLAHDENGNLIINQEKSFREMGILPPRPDKKIGRYNNAKMTYTEMCRAHFIEVCRKNGIEINEELNKNQVGLELSDFKKQKNMLELEQVKQENLLLQENIRNMEIKKNALKQENEELLKRKNEELLKNEKELKDENEKISNNIISLNSELQDKKQEYKNNFNEFLRRRRENENLLKELNLHIEVFAFIEEYKKMQNGRIDDFNNIRKILKTLNHKIAGIGTLMYNNKINAGVAGLKKLMDGVEKAQTETTLNKVAETLEDVKIVGGGQGGHR